MDYRKTAELCLEKAREHFDEAEVYVLSSSALVIEQYNGKLEKYSISNDGGLSLRVRSGKRWASTYSEKISADAVPDLLKKVTEVIDVSEENEHLRLYSPSPDENYRALPRTDQNGFDAEKMLSQSEALCKVIQKKDPSVHTAEVTVQANVNTRLLLNSNGLDREERNRYALVIATAVLDKEGEKKTDYVFRKIENFEALPIEEMADELIKKISGFYGARSIASGKYRVLLDYDTLGTLLLVFSSGFSAEQIQKGMSLLAGKKGEKIASDCVTIFDDPLCAEGFGQSAFDGEGLPTYPLCLVKNGILQDYLYDMETAAKEGLKSNARATRSYKGKSSPGLTTLVLEKGNKSCDELLAQVGNGLMITDLQGFHSGLNPISGDFSLPAKGYVIENGKIGRPVNQITVAGNLFTFLKTIEEVGSEAKLSSSGSVIPSLILSELAVSGDEEA